MEFNKAGTFSYTATHCGSVSVMAVGGGGGGGYQWSSGGGGGGGLGYIKNYDVTKGKTYKIVVGNKGQCISNAGNSHQSDGGTSYFVSTNTVAGYGGGKGGPNAQSSSPGYGGGFKGDGGGRGGYYSSTWGTPAGGGVGLNGWTSESGR